MSPQRGRTTISFENKIWSEEGITARPTLTLFKHTEGAKVRFVCVLSEYFKLYCIDG